MESGPHRYALENLPPEQRWVLESFYAGHLSAGQLIQALHHADSRVRRPDRKPRRQRKFGAFAKRVGFAR
jgi:hypothetical protein